jgi:hypothetical protein
MDNLILEIDDNILYDGICIDCEQPITPDNDSGWHAFTERSGESQKVCDTCWERRCNEPAIKAPGW